MVRRSKSSSQFVFASRTLRLPDLGYNTLNTDYPQFLTTKKGGEEWTPSAVVLHAIRLSQMPK